MNSAPRACRAIRILMAEDDADDRFMTARALETTESDHHLCFVKDGQELLDYLRHEGEYAPPNAPATPAVILLDLNMPRKDGREALEEIKADPRLRCIPVVVLTTSRSEEDVLRSYNLGVNSYIAKPTSFDDLVRAMQVFESYWFGVVELPCVRLRGGE